MKTFIAISLLFSHVALSAPTKDFQYFCEHPDESESAQLTMSAIRERLAFHAVFLEGPCASQWERLKTVKELRLGYGSPALSDLRPFSNLIQLQYLGLPGKAIRDIRPLTTLTSLEHLVLSSNAVDTLPPLAGMTRLRKLDLSNNKIVDATREY